MTGSRFAYALLLGTTLSTPAFAQTENDRDDRGVIVVTGERDDTVSSAGTKSAVPISETPQSISVVDSEEVARLGLQNLNQVLRFVPGVTTEQRGSSAEVYDQFKLRGFDADQYLDGLRIYPSPSGYAATQVDMADIERIEVVKGPASALYGQSGPGGLVALSSKLPLDRDSYGAFSATAGNYDVYRLDGDIGGKLGDNVGWRVYGSANGAHTQQTWGKRERETLSGAVTFGMGGSTSLTLLGSYSHDPYNGTYSGFPASGTFFANPNGKLPTSFDAGEPGNRIKRDQAAGTYILNHDFGGGWHFRASGRYTNIRSNFDLVYSSGALDSADPTDQTLTRGAYVADEKMRSWAFDNQLTGKIETGPIEHNILLGVDSQVLHSFEYASFASFPSINMYNPVYGLNPVPTTPDAVVGGFPYETDYNIRQRGVYGQDEMAWGGLHVTLSGRQDWTRVEPIGSPAMDANKFTYRVGALYKTSLGLAPYISYATSFQPTGNAIVDAAGQPAGFGKPSEGKQLEVGAKYQMPGTDILFTGAWFDIDQNNVLIYNAALLGYQQIGKQTSKGVEFEASAPLPGGFQAKLGFSRQSVRDQDGARVMGVGRGGVTGDLEWAPKSGPLDGFAIGGVVRHVDNVAAGSYNSIAYDTPSYTLVDALVRADVGKFFPKLQGVTASLNVSNLFDKQYLTTCYLAYQWCWYGNRRTVQGTIGFRW